MNHSSELSRGREQLVEQLVLLGDEKKRFLDAYFAMPGKERTDMNEYLSIYTQTVQKLLSCSDAAADEELHSLVLIGSHITISYPEFDTQDAFTIVMPEQADADDNLISFLSPVGSQLLLARLGELISIDTPSGALRVLITAITFAEDDSSRKGGMANGA
jgi:transcription elongation factor GreA